MGSTYMISVDGLLVKRRHYAELSTTMDAALPLARSGGSWMCITADYQSSGRGTHGRSWNAPPGASLMMSLVLPPPLVTEGLESMSVQTAGILCDVLRGHAEADYTIKHPNDLLIGGRKCAGILYESVSCSGAMSTMVLGMGVNLTQTEEEFLGNGLTDATSMRIATGRAPGADELLFGFLERFVPWYRVRAGCRDREMADNMPEHQ